jgi:hypothetical protein
MQAVGSSIVHGDAHTGMRVGGSIKDTGMSGTVDGHKASLGAGSGTLTYSTLANVPKAKRQKLISEAKPMVNRSMIITVFSWEEPGSARMCGTPSGRPTSERRASSTKLISTWFSTRTSRLSTTCCVSRHHQTS